MAEPEFPEGGPDSLRELRTRRGAGGFWGFLAEFLRHLRGYILTGLLVWVPLFFTLWVTWWFIDNVGFGIERSIERVLNWFNEVGARRSYLAFLTAVEYRRGVGLLIALLLFLTTGFLTRYYVTRKAIALGEQVLARIPLVSRIYSAVQQIRDVFVGQGAVFQEVVLIEYPRNGVWSIAFITQRDQGIVQKTLDGEYIAVFLPTTPNPTSGYLLIYPSEQVRRLPISIEDAMKMIISGGAYMPKEMASLPYHPDLPQGTFTGQKDRQGDDSTR